MPDCSAAVSGRMMVGIWRRGFAGRGGGDDWVGILGAGVGGMMGALKGWEGGVDYYRCGRGRGRGG